MPISSEDVAMRPRILLLSGTSEGPVLGRALLDAGLDVVATVTREEAVRHLFEPLHGELTVEVQGFDAPGLRQYLGSGVYAVLDATHPFAVQITRIARDVCAELGVPYVRYERPDWLPPEGTHLAETFAEAAVLVPKLGNRIMLTIGANSLKYFAHLHGCLTMFARILPAAESLARAFAAGFTPDRVFCMRPPFSREFNRAFFAEYRTEVLVVKASGVAGGIVEKVEAAQQLGMSVLMIKRPSVESAAAVSRIAEAVALCRALVERGSPTGPG